MVNAPTAPVPVAPTLGHPDDPVAALPPPGSPDRWPWLQRLRRQPSLTLEPWLRALEQGALPAQTDLLTVLSDHLDGAAMGRLLRWWSLSEPWDPALPALIVPRRDPLARQALHEAWSAAEQDLGRRVALLPLLGHQRNPADFPLLRQMALEPGPGPLRRAALEGLCRGLGAWPRPALRHTLRVLVSDLHPPLAEAAVDALARLPEARPLLIQLSRQELDAAVAARLRRRLGRLPAHPLVLLIHGRAGAMARTHANTGPRRDQSRAGSSSAKSASSRGSHAARRTSSAASLAREAASRMARPRGVAATAVVRWFRRPPPHVAARRSERESTIVEGDSAPSTACGGGLGWRCQNRLQARHLRNQPLLSTRPAHHLLRGCGGCRGMNPDYSSRALRRCRRGMNSTATKAIYEQSA